MEEYRVAFWKKESSKGTTYYSGKLKIGDREYQCNLFKNNKTNEKQPDLNLIVRNNTNNQGAQKTFEKEQKNSELEENKQQQFTVDDVFEEFGNMLEQEEDILPF